MDTTSISKLGVCWREGQVVNESPLPGDPSGGLERSCASPKITPYREHARIQQPVKGCWAVVEAEANRLQ